MGKHGTSGTSWPLALDTACTEVDFGTLARAAVPNDISQAVVAMQADLSSGMWIYDNTYSTLQAAINAAYPSGKTLLLTKNHVITADTNVNVSVWPLSSGSITQGGVAILTVSGNVVGNPKHKWFYGFSVGQVLFEGGNCESVLADWWGRDATGIQSAINSWGNGTALQSGGGTVRLLRGQYDLGTTGIVINKYGIRLIGEGMGWSSGGIGITNLVYEGSGAGIQLSTHEQNAYNYELANFRLKGMYSGLTPVGDTGVRIGAENPGGYYIDGSVATGRMQNLFISGFANDGIQCGNAEVSQFDNIFVHNCGTGVHLEGSTNTTVLWNNLRILECLNIGLHIEGCKKYTFVGGAIDGCKNEALRIETRACMATFVNFWCEANLAATGTGTKYQVYILDNINGLELSHITFIGGEFNNTAPPDGILPKQMYAKCESLTLINSAWNYGASGSQVISPMSFIDGTTKLTLIGDSTPLTDFTLASGVRVNTQQSKGEMLITEIPEPANPAANDASLFCKDNGSGKTQLCARFASGATQVIATEP